MAADRGILIGWNRVVPGKESQAMALFGEALAFWSTAAGRDDRELRTGFLSPHGGDMNGFILIRGEMAKLGQVMETDEYLTIQQKASYLLDGHGVIGAVFGEGINRNMAIYQKVTSGG